jgi:hypothetical protein
MSIGSFLTTIWALQVPLAAANKINAASLVISVFPSKAHDAPVCQIRRSQIQKAVVGSSTEIGPDVERKFWSRSAKIDHCQIQIRPPGAIPIAQERKRQLSLSRPS